MTVSLPVNTLPSVTKNPLEVILLLHEQSRLLESICTTGGGGGAGGIGKGLFCGSEPSGMAQMMPTC